jgi:hypothetical protein
VTCRSKDLRKIPTAGVVIILVSQLLSCSALTSPRIDTIAFRSVKIMTTRADIPRPDKDLTGTPILPVVMVTFATNTDFGNLAKDGYSLGVSVSICNDKHFDDNKRIIAFPYLHDSHGLLFSFRSTSSRPAGNLGPIAYHIFFYVSVRKEVYPDRLSYNLENDTPDICFEVAGVDEGLPIISDIAPTRFRSSTVVIPKESLKAALARAGLN